MNPTLRRVSQVALWVFASIGLLYVVVTVFFMAVAPRFICGVERQSAVNSPDGLFVAKFVQEVCPKGARKPNSEITLSKSSNPNSWILLLRVATTTTDVSMTWTEPRKLLITVPEGTVTSDFNPNPTGPGGDSYGISVLLKGAAQPLTRPGEQLPNGRNVGMDGEEMQRFKQWLTERRIPYRTQFHDGREFVIWDEENTAEVIKFDHLAEVMPETRADPSRTLTKP
jgi:hypothetical protein